LIFPKFDPSLGTLKSVNVALAYSIQNDFSMTFSAPATITVSATSAHISVDRPDKTAIVTASPTDVTKTQTISGPPFPKDVSFPGVDRSDSLAPVSLTSKADLALFSAVSKGDTIALPITGSSASTFMSSTANGTGRVNTLAGAQVTITYTYTPVPEPAGFAILGAGALLLFSLRRKRS
jgi:hypothetical protein